MKKKLQFKKAKNTIALLTFIAFGISNALQAQQMVGTSLDGNFNTDGVLGLWSTQNAGATATVSGGFLNMTMALQGNAKYRADIWYNFSGTTNANNIVLNSSNDSYIAIKFKGARPTGGALKFEMERVLASSTVYDNSAWNSAPNGSFTDANGDVTYYFNLALDADFTGGNLNYRKLHFIIADSPTETSYKVDWIATFPTTAAIQTYMAATLGVNDNQIASNDLKLYPNPSTGNSFNLDLGNSISESTVNIKVYDILGKLVLENNFATNATIQVNHNLKSGVYIVKINNSNNTKLVIK